MTNPIKYFLENFGKEPEPRPPLIPEPWRIPFFVVLSVVSVVALVLLVYFIVIPGMQATQSATPAPASTQVK